MLKLLLRTLDGLAILGMMPSGAALAEECSGNTMKHSDVTVRTYGCLAMITGLTNFDVTNKGQDISVELRFHSIWAKRAPGVQFVSWEATRVPPKQ